jgi:hypothetical protein
VAALSDLNGLEPRPNRVCQPGRLDKRRLIQHPPERAAPRCPKVGIILLGHIELTDSVMP